MKVLFAAAECAPFFKSGGLGDVAGALPKELKKQGVDVRVILPYHTMMPEAYREQLVDVVQFSVKVGWRNQFCGIKQLLMDDVIYYFVDNQFYFDRPAIYGFPDDGERFAFFSQAVIEAMEKIDFLPDLLHVNDWHTSIIPVLLKDKYNIISEYSAIKTVLTIHNLQFQGVYDQIVLSDLFGIGYSTYHEHGLKYHDQVNLLKGGIYFADLVTTVSPTYALEIQTTAFGEGLDDVLRINNNKLVGILNGIDYQVFNPSKDQIIEENYSVKNISGKIINKAALQEKVGLPVDETIAIIAMVTRLTSQKGVHLVQDMMEDLMKRNIQLIILGTGDKEFECNLRYFNSTYENKFKAIIDFDLTLAQMIYAGSDLFLMPSAFEPCGLSQLYSMRYGTLPLVHETGGLKDTVEAYNQYKKTGTGFTFYDYTCDVMLQTIDYALTIYYGHKDEWNGMVKRAMGKNHSWKKSTKAYIKKYQALINK